MKVACKLNNQGQAQSEVPHSMTEYQFIKGYENKNQGKLTSISYAESMTGLIKVVQAAKVCWQKIYFKDCSQVSIRYNSYFLDRNGQEFSFRDPECHCQNFDGCINGAANLLVGNVTSRSRLPLTGISVADTGDSGEETYVLVGSLECL